MTKETLMVQVALLGMGLLVMLRAFIKRKQWSGLQVAIVATLGLTIFLMGCLIL